MTDDRTNWRIACLAGQLKAWHAAALRVYQDMELPVRRGRPGWLSMWTRLALNAAAAGTFKVSFTERTEMPRGPRGAWKYPKCPECKGRSYPARGLLPRHNGHRAGCKLLGTAITVSHETTVNHQFRANMVELDAWDLAAQREGLEAAEWCRQVLDAAAKADAVLKAVAA